MLHPLQLQLDAHRGVLQSPWSKQTRRQPGPSDLPLGATVDVKIENYRDDILRPPLFLECD